MMKQAAWERCAKSFEMPLMQKIAVPSDMMKEKIRIAKSLFASRKVAFWGRPQAVQYCMFSAEGDMESAERINTPEMTVL